VLQAIQLILTDSDFEDGNKYFNNMTIK